MKAQTYAAGLRAVADFVEENADFLDNGGGTNLLGDELVRFYAPDAAAIAGFVRLFGKAEKEYSDAGLFYLRTKIGGLPVEVFSNRGNVCRKIVKGTRVVPAVTIPEQHIPEREEEIVEWECEPILAGGAS